MERNLIIAELDRELARLREARALLSGSLNGVEKPKAKRPRLSPEARKRIAEAQKKRWAKLKKAAQ